MAIGAIVQTGIVLLRATMPRKAANSILLATTCSELSCEHISIGIFQKHNTPSSMGNHEGVFCVFFSSSYYLDKEVQLSPFTRPAAIALKKSIEDFLRHNANISLSTFSSKLKARNLKAVCKTFHRGGLVVPFDRSTDIGYRHLQESDANLKKMLAKLSTADGDQDAINAALDKLQPLITAANIGE